MIKLYNTMTRRKEIFEAIEGNKIKIFVCGPTVYDYSHIGHARTYISFDVIVRYLKYKGFSVFYMQNITDLDDKILKRAEELETSPLDLARRYEEKYLHDMEILGVKNVNLYARATEHIPEIIRQIAVLIKKDYAYETDKGVYFDESKFEDFGKLSNRNIDELNVHRIGPDTSKRNPGDFALWKKRERKFKGQEMIWDSPWGTGRPGWHIEDTAITETYFGTQYDIHGGGLDLIFPHHEAEIAQMEAASGKKPMVRYWMHTGFLNVKGEKMSKSLGNFIRINELLEKYPPEVFRFFVLSTHYRSPIDFSNEILQQASHGLDRIYKLIENINEALDGDTSISLENDQDYIQKLSDTREEFFDAMDNDFNTPAAFSTIFDIIRDVNRDLNQNNISKNSLTKLKAIILEFGYVLGLDFSLNQEPDETLEEDLLDLLKYVRDKLRDEKNWELSDDIRSKLKEMNIILEDKKT